MLSSRILYQSSACLVINKLKGEASQGVKIAAQGVKIAAQGVKIAAQGVKIAAKAAQGSKAEIVNLPKELKKIFGEAEIIQAAHRVDVPVTGCCLFALTKNALSFLFSEFADNKTPIEKKYWAIVEKPDIKPEDNAQLVHWIEINEKQNKTYVYNEETPKRKKAILNYKIIGEGNNYLFLEVQLISGRHHQIRAQLAAVGLYIKGDVKYGARRSEKDGGIRLHARYLSFPNPLNPIEQICITADPPQMDTLWQTFLTQYGIFNLA